MMSETMPYDKKFLDVNGRKIAYVDEGSGNPIVLLHGNPMSSFLWRNVAPELLASGRVIIPDLIGHPRLCAGLRIHKKNSASPAA